MLIKSGKSVEKAVKKSAQNWWKKNVQKCEKVSFTQISEKSTEVLQNIIDSFYTKKLFNYSLLRSSFTHYSHSSTITTTTYK
jgi:hypothetical protein